MEDLDGGIIDFMTYVFLWDAPPRLFERWVRSLGTPEGFSGRQSVWRIAMIVEARGVSS